MASAAATDEFWMRRALELAQKGTALAHPNPKVGAVIVRHGRAVGEGFHTFDGVAHAEVIALQQAGTAARGATLYVNLEPCCHVGRTGPCTEAILAAGIQRVVAAMPDPNPRVSGRGLARLRRAGLEVAVGICREQAERLNDAFAVWIRQRRPRVLLKAALSLDAQLLLSWHGSRRVTGPAARAEVQRLRHEADAVMTGIGTVLADDPLLTDRTGLPRRRPLLRVILDSRLRLPLDSRLVRSAARDVLVFTLPTASQRRARELERRGVEVIRLSGRNGRLDLRRVLRELGRREILGLLVEAGARLNGSLLAAGLVDRAILFYAPKLAGAVVVPFAHPPRPPRRPWRLLRPRWQSCGDDLVVEGYLRHVYRDH